MTLSPLLRPGPEVELGRAVRAWLTEQQADVYQEVEGPRGRCDLVAVIEPVVLVVELKMQLSFALLEQARRWRGWSHQVWVAVPSAKRGAGRGMAELVFEDYGIGILSVHYSAVRVAARPAFDRQADVRRLKASLFEEQKTAAEAGTAAGGQWTTFKRTCKALAEAARANPGIQLGDALKAIPHHYASHAGARSSIAHWLKRGKVPGVRCEREGKALKLFAEASPC